MLQQIGLVASQVGTLFLMMAVGFLLAKLGRITREGLSQMTGLLLSVIIPCLLVDSLQTERTPALLAAMGSAALVSALLYAAYCVLVIPLFPRQSPDTRAPLRFGVVYGNVGFMGLPLIAAVLGEDGMVYATVIFVMFNLYNWSHGVVLMGGRENFSLRRTLFNPGIIATVLGLVFFFAGFTLPSMVGDAVSFLGSMNTPLAMVVIGAQMAWADLKATFRDSRLYAAAACKLIALPVFTALVLLPFRLDPLLYSSLVILAATPSGGTASMFAQQFGRDAVCGAQVITITTLLSIFTLPCCAVMARLLGGA